MKKNQLLNLRSKNLEGLRQQGSLLDKQLLLSETGITAKQFHYWKKNGLIATDGGRGWTEISFVDFMWLKVLDAMRGFGCSVKLMKRIYDDQFTKAFDENLAESTLKENLNCYRNLSKIRELTSDEKELYDLSVEISNDPNYSRIIRRDISYFYQSIVSCINEGKEDGFIIFPDESYRMINGINQSVDIGRPLLYIPFSHFIVEIMEDSDKDEFLNSIGMISDDERRLINEIRANNVEKITITRNMQSGEIKKTEYANSGIIEGKKAKEIMKTLGLRNYSSIQLSTRNGTTLSFTKTDKIYRQ
jgi:DNA-binding transcriptional MerR regulator